MAGNRSNTRVGWLNRAGTVRIHVVLTLTDMRIQRAWHYLQLSLARNDVEEGDWTYRKVVADTMFELDQSTRLPNWIVSFFLVGSYKQLIAAKRTYGFE
jgi:hypothetical protein